MRNGPVSITSMSIPTSARGTPRPAATCCRPALLMRTSTRLAEPSSSCRMSSLGGHVEARRLGRPAAVAICAAVSRRAGRDRGRSPGPCGPAARGRGRGRGPSPLPAPVMRMLRLGVFMSGRRCIGRGASRRITLFDAVRGSGGDEHDVVDLEERIQVALGSRPASRRFSSLPAVGVVGPRADGVDHQPARAARRARRRPRRLPTRPGPIADDPLDLRGADLDAAEVHRVVRPAVARASSRRATLHLVAVAAQRLAVRAARRVGVIDLVVVPVEQRRRQADRRRHRGTARRSSAGLPVFVEDHEVEPQRGRVERRRHARLRDGAGDVAAADLGAAAVFDDRPAARRAASASACRRRWSTRRSS